MKIEESNGSSMEAVIIGAMILDVHAKPTTSPISGTTVQGQVLFTPGGVGRNVAECIFKLGIKPFMIATLGLDGPANVLLKEWKLSMEGILRSEDISTPIVSLVYDVNGEVAAGVAGVDAVEKFLTPEWIKRFKHKISSAPIVVVDANLSTLALEASCGLAAECNVPVWFEPVSVTKSQRIASIAKYVTIVSPNQDELIAMANSLCKKTLFRPFKFGEKKHTPEDIFRELKPAICVLLENGIKVVIVTLGSNGALLCSKGNPRKAVNVNQKFTKSGDIFKRVQLVCSRTKFSEFGSSHCDSRSLFAVYFPTVPAKVKKLTGAGDCLVGGTAASLSYGLDIIQSLAVGIVSAKAAVESDDNVPLEFMLDLVSDDAESVYNGAKMLLAHQSML